jgi:hypothetical protein
MLAKQRPAALYRTVLQHIQLPAVAHVLSTRASQIEARGSSRAPNCATDILVFAVTGRGTAMGRVGSCCRRRTWTGAFTV